MKHDTGRSNVTGGARRERFEALYAAHHRHLARYVLRRTAGAEDAADVIAETFLVAWRRIDEAPVENVRLWLYGVARRLLANHRRGERRRNQLAVELQSNLTVRYAAHTGQEVFDKLAAAFRALSDADREILTLEGWEQLDPGEIATVLGCSRNAARIRLHRARRRLRAALAGTQGPAREPTVHVRPVTGGDIQ